MAEDKGMEGRQRGCCDGTRMPSDSPSGPTAVNHTPGPTDVDSVTEEVGLGSPSPPFLPSQDCPQECSPLNLDPQASA